MSHTYLIDLYELIEERLKKIEVAAVDEHQNLGENNFLQGRREVLLEFRLFLARHYNSKLPRRLRNRYPVE